VAGCCENGNELSGSIKDEFPNQMSDYQLLKDSAPWRYLIMPII